MLNLNIYNKKSSYTNEKDNLPFVSAKDLFEQNGATAEYKINGLFINSKSKFGSHPVIASDTFNISLTGSHTDNIMAMMSDEELTQYINEGKIYCKFYEFTSKTYGRTGIGVEYIAK